MVLGGVIEASCYDAAIVQLAKLSYRKGKGYPSKYVSEQLRESALLDSSDYVGLPFSIWGSLFFIRIDKEQLRLNLDLEECSCFSFIHLFIHQYTTIPYHVQGIGNLTTNRKDSSSQPRVEDNLNLLMTKWGRGRSEVRDALVAHGHGIKTLPEDWERPSGKTKINVEI